MRHKKSRLQLNRFTSWRKSTLRSLARTIIIHQSIRTTLHKAKAAQPYVDKLITLAKSNTLVARRECFKVVADHRLVNLLFTQIGPRFANRNGGYTRIINLGNRRGDNSRVVIFELTEIKKKEAKKPKKEEKEIKPDAQKMPEQQKEKPPIEKKPTKKFLGGIKNIFKKERDSL